MSATGMTPDETGEAGEQVRRWLTELTDTRAAIEQTKRRERGLLLILSGLADLHPTVKDLIPADVWTDIQQAEVKRRRLPRRSREGRSKR